MGGHKGVDFTLAYRLELSPEESELVGRYKLGGYVLTRHTVQGQEIADDTIASMLTGRTQTLSDAITLLRNEEIVKQACDALPPLFDVVRSFGGDEVIEYPRDT